MQVSVGALDEAQIVLAGQSLARAFHDDPFQTCIFPDPAERERRSPAQFAVFTRLASRFGEIVATRDLSSVAAWLPPDLACTSEQYRECGYHDLPALMGAEACNRMGTVLDICRPRMAT